MVFSKSGVEVVVVESLRAVLVGEYRPRLGMLLEVLNIIGSVPALERGEVASAPVLPLP